MVIVVTSTLKPANYSFFDDNARLGQTRQTLDSLIGKAAKVILADNSPGISQAELDDMLHGHPEVEKVHLPQYQFANKGITEVMMLLYVCSLLPSGVPVFKISGRYTYTKPLLTADLPHADFAGKGYGFDTRRATVSTRGYWIKDAAVFETLLLATLSNMFTYPERTTGLRSFFNKLCKTLFNKDFVKIDTSVEFAMALALKSGRYKFKLTDDIGIQGYVAGAGKPELLTE